MNTKAHETSASVDSDILSIQLVGIRGIGEVKRGEDLAGLIWQAQSKSRIRAEDGDIYVIAQKVVSKAEGRMVNLEKVVPSRFSMQLGREIGKDPREVEVILGESRRVVKARLGILITETRSGIVCANAGVDRSNVPGENNVLLLPLRPDMSAWRLRRRLQSLTGKKIAVVISDTFGRPWREGQVDFAIGASGIKCIRDYRGTPDMNGRNLRVTAIAQADELAAAAELVMGKTKGVPVVIVRGYRYEEGSGSKELLRHVSRDLFR
ncbi:MAG: coenzyme F420-0:L-glutamate ligase [Nitrososphaerota archaeon]|jgi:coenzyme F420-0:L-glutamate ligase/coenzyme F420-1:gamma-L-glutamate ligase|nr:coenzyme F420-0:L-glutamate ligase [Nitrososphaerota archaeon]